MPEQPVLANHQKPETSTGSASESNPPGSKRVNEQNRHSKSKEKNAKGSANALSNKRILKRCRLRCQQRQSRHPVTSGWLPDTAAAGWSSQLSMNHGAQDSFSPEGLVQCTACLLFALGLGFFPLFFSLLNTPGFTRAAISFLMRAVGVQPVADYSSMAPAVCE